MRALENTNMMLKLFLPLVPLPHSLVSTVVLSTEVPVHHLPSLHLGGAPGPVRILAVIPSSLAVLLVIVLEGELAGDLAVSVAAN